MSYGKRGHKLLTKEIKQCLGKPRETEGQDDPIVCAKFFHPMSSWDWYPIEYDEESRIFYGYVAGLDCEFGDFSFDELENIGKDGSMLPIERDLGFKPKPISEVKKRLIEYGRCR